jgi:anti-sigma factor RsiW
MAPAAHQACPFAERAISRNLDGLLSRRERRRLGAHLRTCEPCTDFARFQHRQSAALRKLRFVPVPPSLQVFRPHGV